MWRLAPVTKYILLSTCIHRSPTVMSNAWTQGWLSLQVEQRTATGETWALTRASEQPRPHMQPLPLAASTWLCERREAVHILCRGRKAEDRCASRITDPLRLRVAERWLSTRAGGFSVLSAVSQTEDGGRTGGGRSSESMSDDSGKSARFQA